MADASKQGLSCHPMSAPIGYGCSGLGNLYEVIPDAVADSTLAEAWRAGYRYFDTSPFYGFGLSELRVGRFLRSVPRKDFILSTKVGRYITPLRGQPHEKLHWAGPLELRPVFDYSYDGIMRSIEQSIVRLGFEQIDIFLIHDVDRWTHGEAFPRMFATAMEGAYRALDELRRHGHVKAIGVGLNEADVASDFIRAGDFDCIMLAGRYTLLEQDALQSFLPYCVEKNIGVVIGGPFNSGILATGPKRGAFYNYAPAPEAVLERVRRIEAICKAHGVKLAEAALRFPLSHPAILSVIPGGQKAGEVRRNAAMLSAQIPSAVWRALKTEGLMRADAPTPR